jgi:hypothetical protein
VSDSINSGASEGDILESSFQRRRWYHQRDFRFLLVVVIFIFLFQGYGFFSSSSRIGEKLEAAISSGETKLEILVWAKFPAEAFHMELYQTLGAIRGEQQGAVRLAGVVPSDIKFLSRKYWIKTIEIAPPEK